MSVNKSPSKIYISAVQKLKIKVVISQVTRTVKVFFSCLGLFVISFIFASLGFVCVWALFVLIYISLFQVLLSYFSVPLILQLS